MVDIGTLRPSQLVTTFGPGSLVNLQNDCVMVLGLQFWPRDTEDKSYFKKITHQYLSNQLGVDYFKMPLSDKKESAIPCVSFPQWGVCQNPKCSILQKHGSIDKTKKGFFCKFCDEKDLPLFAARFVQICDNGHIDEFPWVRWAHIREQKGKIGGEVCAKSKENPKLRFYTTKKGTSLSDYVVECAHCGVSSSLGGATDVDKFQRLGLTKCFGRQPWIGRNDKKICNAKPYGAQTRSSMVYYPAVVTSLLIPRWLHDVDVVLDKDDGKNAQRIRQDREDGKDFKDIVEWHKNGIFKKLFDEGINTDEIIERLKLRFDNTHNEISTEGQSLEIEFDDFSSVTDIIKRPGEGDLKVHIEPINVAGTSLKEFNIDSLMKFHRLVAIKVLRGFTRGTPLDPFASEETVQKKDPFRRLSSKNQRDAQTGELVPIKWLPGVETRGEGIFFKFNEEKLQKWEENPKVHERAKTLVESYADSMKAQDRAEVANILERFLSPRYLLLHTFSHLLIREMSYVAGYNEASLAERIYCTSNSTNKRNGILIYTSSMSSEGSLGGLVRLGGLDKFPRIVEDTIKRAQVCSRDPLCIETDPVKSKMERISSGLQLTGASCYSCTLLPETSCHNFNNLLDRWMLIDKDYGFFKDQIKD